MRAKAEGWIAALLLILAAAVALTGYWYYRTVRLNGADGSNGSGDEAALVAGKRMEVTLFFATPDGVRLAPETRTVADVTAPPARCRLLLAELARGPRTGLASVLPAEFEVRGLFLADRLLVVDLEPKLRAWQPGVTQEVLMWYAVVNSVTRNVPEVKNVRFLMGGREIESPLWHLGLRGDLAPRPELES